MALAGPSALRRSISTRPLRRRLETASSPANRGGSTAAPTRAHGMDTNVNAVRRTELAGDVAQVAVQRFVAVAKRAAPQACFFTVHHGPQATFVAGDVGPRESRWRGPWRVLRVGIGARQCGVERLRHHTEHSPSAGPGGGSFRRRKTGQQQIDRLLRRCGLAQVAAGACQAVEPDDAGAVEIDQGGVSDL